MLNYSDCETLRAKLVPRVVTAIRKFLLYTQGGGGSPSQTRKDWCTANISNVGSMAEQLSHYLMSEPGFLGVITRGATPADDTWSGGTDISDAAIQSRVEYVLTSYSMPA